MALKNSHPLNAQDSSSHPILIALTFILTPCLWVVFAGTWNSHELIVGVAASILTIAFTLFVCRLCSTNLDFRARDLAQGWRVPGYILIGVYEITLVLIKDLLHLTAAKSLYRVSGFDASAHDPVRQARAILAIAYTTATPNFIVIGIDPAQSRMLFHQIEPTGIPKMTQALGARP